ncbi:MAG TPA: CBS domain-containing protein [Anaeromyxobacteraceae bacterium]|nr:CBS domain-containing protein [Anaeromyxobacteraceae bacterium]
MIDVPASNVVEAMEGDEGELEVGRHADVGRQLLQTVIGELKRESQAVSVGPDTTVGKAVELMLKKDVSAVLIVDRKKPKKLIGIFTERDFMKRALTARGVAKQPVKKFMTKDPESLRAKDSVAYAVNKMSVSRFRHVPVVDERGVPKGMVSARDVIDFVCELCPEELLNLPPDSRHAVPRDQEGP